MSQSITAEIDGSTLVVRIPMNPQPTPSGSGKTLVVASSHGNQVTALEVDGKPVTVGLNAYIKR